MADLKKFISDYSAFARYLGTGNIVIVLVNVNDFLFFRPKLTEIYIMKSFLTN